MRSKQSLNSPFSDWERQGERLVRATAAGELPAVQAPTARRFTNATMKVLWDRMLVGWLVLGIRAGMVVGGLFGLFAGPLGIIPGAIFGGFVGGFLAMAVLVQAGIIYGIRKLFGRPPRATGQHTRCFIVLPAVLLAIPLLLSPTSAIITGPPLATGLIFGPRVVRKALRPLLPPIPRPPDVFNDSPQEVTS